MVCSVTNENQQELPVLSVVAPVYNEEKNVSELVDRIVKSCREIGVPFEIVVVNDGSRDGTLARLVALSREIPELRVINLLRNFGHMPALSAGLSLARGAGVVIMDGDLQDPPELIPRFFRKWREGFDVVYGLRTERGEQPVKRVAISGFYWLLSKLSDTKIPTQVGTFSLIDRRVADVLCAMPERDRYFAGLRAWVGGEQAFVPYERPDRADGTSRVGLRGLLHLARAGLLSFSKAPLRIASVFSIVVGVAMLLVGTQAVVKRLFTRLAIPGWASTLTMLGALGFSQSLIMAVISEYLAVIFSEIKGRPLYLVREEYVGGKRVGKAGLATETFSV